MRLKTITTLCAAIALTIGITSCSDMTGGRVLKMSHNHNQMHPVHVALMQMGEDLKEISGGKMQLEVYSGAQLGDEDQCIEMLQIGSLAMTKVSSASLSNSIDEFKLFGLPYMFESKQQLADVLSSDIGEELLHSTERYLFRGLCFFDSGARSFYTTKKPILTPDDLKGLKIRVMPNAMAINMMTAFGGSATPINHGELYTALQSGVVDGAENNPPSYQLGHEYEVAPYYSMSEHLMLPDVLIMSNIIWNDMSEQEQKWLMQAVKRAQVYQSKLWSESEEEAMRIVKEAGVEVVYPDKKPFIELVKDQPEKYKDNKDLYRVIEMVKEFKENERL